MFTLIISGCSTKNNDKENSSNQDSELSNSTHIAVIDSGINSINSSLEETIVETKSFIEETNDDIDHGTPISAIIVSDKDALNKNVYLHSYKVIDSAGKVDKQAFLNALQHIKMRGDIDIINISFGFRNGSSDIKAAINELVEQGVVIVASSGNTFGLNADYPAKYSNVISVSSIDTNNKPLRFNAKGKIDFVAPGSNITSISSQGEEAQYNGSSFAAPYITKKVLEILDKKDIPKNKDRYTTVHKVLQSMSTNLGKKEIYGEGVPEKK